MKCIIQGCTNYAGNNFGVRLRNPETNAIWAPNTDAMICDQHAVVGMEVQVHLKPTGDGCVTTVVNDGMGPTVTRRLKITKAP